MKIPLSAFLLPLPFLLAGCDFIPAPQADATRYYVLSGPVVSSVITPGPAAANAGAASPAARMSAANRGLRLGLKRVELAGYLKTRSMVVRNGTNEVVLEDFQRWAEPLDEGIGRMVLARLLADPAVGRVLPQPFPFDAERDYDIAIEVIRCEGGTDGSGGGAARFAAVVEITTAGSNPLVVAHNIFAAPDAAWDGRDFGQLAALLGGDVAALSREIVSSLPPVPGP